MKFEKRNFMGVELDVLVGHPEHDLLFIATQAMRVSGLKDPASRIRDSKRRGDVEDRKLSSLMGQTAIKLPLDSARRAIKGATLFATEAELYDMMLRGHSPQSEPFRKWVTEEVLPSIRKTGKYSANEAQDKESIQFSGRFRRTQMMYTCRTSRAVAQRHPERNKAAYQPQSGRLATKNDGLLPIRSIWQPEPRCSTPVAKSPHGPECAT